MMNDETQPPSNNAASAANSDVERHNSKMAKKKAARDKIMATKTDEKGLIIVHTGKGKGKSSAAFGMIFRCIAHDMKCAVVQFIKGGMDTGERNLISANFPELCEFHTMGEGFTWETQDKERDIAAASAAWQKAKDLIRDESNRMVLLDEVNIADHHDRNLGSKSKAHVGNIASPQINLGGTASAFDNDQVGITADSSKTVQHMWHQRRFVAAIFTRTHAAKTLSLHDDLRACLCFGFQQDRIHVNTTRHPAGKGLHRLRPAYLATIGSNCRIVRHVLRFERAHSQTLIGKISAQTSNQNRFANI